MSANVARAVAVTVLGIDADTALFSRRGFPTGDVSAREHLEEIGRTFIYGYNQALGSSRVDALVATLDGVPRNFRGFAFEGAAMASHLLDLLTLSRTRWQALHDRAGDRYLYLLYVGMGWVWARIPVSLAWSLERRDPLYGWLAVDGLGFHAGYFDTSTYVEEQRYPRRVVGYARRAFDQGLGRSLWFSRGARASAIAATIERYPHGRRSDLWAGVGLASAYAGGVSEEGLEDLVALSQGFHSALAQGVAFAAEARVRANDIAPWTAQVCASVCACSVEEASARTRLALERVGPHPQWYERWRAAVQATFAPVPMSSGVRGANLHGTSTGRRVEPDRQTHSVGALSDLQTPKHRRELPRV
jgi:enediyne biosynthesis protein E3